MSRSLCPSVLAGGAVLLGTSGAAVASPMEWSFTTTPGNVNDAAGDFESISGSYNEATHRFTWSITFADTVTEGFTLAVNDGPNPKGHAGELALLYFSWDEDTDDVALSAYAYNGQNNQSSYLTAGGGAPDFIQGTETTPNAPSWLLDASVVDANGKRTMSFEIDAGGIQGHDPLYPDANDPWTGVAFDDHVGFWLHSFEGGSGASYDANGLLDGWSWGAHGWWDVNNVETAGVVVPLPPAAIAGLVGLAGVGVLRRRRA